MTEIIQSVHIIQEPISLNDNNDVIEINYNLCMARKANGLQCSHRKKTGDYCGIHLIKTNLKRIDEPIIKKKKNSRKILNEPIINNKSNDKLIFKNAIELGARNIDKVVRIQTVFKGWFMRYLNKMRGPGLFNRRICNNQEDIYLFEPINNIHLNDFFSFLDEDGFIYGFHLESIYKYIENARDKNSINNPYNKNIIPKNIITNIVKLYKTCSRLGFHDKIKNELPNDEKFKIRSKVMNVFQKMDELNNYTDIEWFLGLTHVQLYKLISNIKDLFDYRMELNSVKKYKILKNGHIFIKNNGFYKHLTFNAIRNEIIDEFDRLVSEGETRDDKYLGSLIILSALVEMVPTCALAYPWLIQGTFGHI